MNFDNSPSLQLARRRMLARTLDAIGLLAAQQKVAIEFFRVHDVRWADVTKKIPLPDSSTEVVYSSHMLEHLDRDQVRTFLAETRRVLASGGRLRLAVPDLRRLASQYIESGDADAFMEHTWLGYHRPHSMKGLIKTLFVGYRNHCWMYDASSLSRLLTSSGFHNVVVLPAGETSIPSPEGLDLREREDESVYVEAKK
jgi:predicted SAM-dependent methyltransferase